MKLIKTVPLLISVIAQIAAQTFAADRYSSDQQAAEMVIRSQLEAFQAGDTQTAYDYAAPSIKKIFPDVEQFMSMVRSSYQPVYSPQSVMFMDYIGDHSPPLQHVIIVGPKGNAWDVYYSMSQVGDGNWKIAGVHMFNRDESAI